MKNYTIHLYSERSLLIQWQGVSLQDAHRWVNHLYLQLQPYQHQWGWQLVPAYNSLLVVVQKHSELPMAERIIDEILLQPLTESNEMPAAMITIPVCYHPALGNDLEALSTKLGIDTATIVAIHTAEIYHVFMLGFLPGFAYMGLVNEAIAAPRKPKPVATKAGAVGIAGRQTGIYPVDSAGGWQIVGYTPSKMFDVQKTPPALLKPGDLVKFEAIELEEYYERSEKVRESERR